MEGSSQLQQAGQLYGPENGATTQVCRTWTMSPSLTKPVHGAGALRVTLTLN